MWIIRGIFYIILISNVELFLIIPRKDSISDDDKISLQKGAKVNHLSLCRLMYNLICFDFKAINRECFLLISPQVDIQAEESKLQSQNILIYLERISVVYSSSVHSRGGNCGPATVSLQAYKHHGGAKEEGTGMCE